MVDAIHETDSEIGNIYSGGNHRAIREMQGGSGNVAGGSRKGGAQKHFTYWLRLSIGAYLLAVAFGMSMMNSAGMLLGGTEYLDQPGTIEDRILLAFLFLATIGFAAAVAFRGKAEADPELETDSMTDSGIASYIGAVTCGLTLVVFVAGFFPALLIPLLVMILTLSTLGLFLLEGYTERDARSLKDAVVAGIALISLFAALSLAMLQVVSAERSIPVSELLARQLQILGLGV